MRLGDAYGETIMAWYKREAVHEIIERSDGYIDFGDASSYSSNYKDWTRVEREAVKLVKGRVLDIGCGAGRHALYLQSRGLNVLGIDNSPLAVKVCRLKGLRKVEVLDIKDVKGLKGSFDTILMLGYNFGLLGCLKTGRRVLKDLYNISSSNALILAETFDPEKTSEKAHLMYHKMNKKRGWLPGRVKIRVRYKSMATKWFYYLFASKKTMKFVLEGTGWFVKKFIDSDDNKGYIAVIGKE